MQVAAAINHPFGDDEGKYNDRNFIVSTSLYRIIKIILDDFQVGELISRHVWVGSDTLSYWLLTILLMFVRPLARSCHSTGARRSLQGGAIRRWRPWSPSTPSMTRNEEKGDANNYNRQVTINSIPLFTQFVSTPLISSKVDLNLSVPTCRPRSRCPPEPRPSGTCRRCRWGGSCGSALSTCRDRRTRSCSPGSRNS